MESQETKVAVMQEQIKYIVDKVSTIDKKLDDKYVTKEEFLPIKNLVYGVTGLMLAAMIVAGIALVIK